MTYPPSPVLENGLNQTRVFFRMMSVTDPDLCKRVALRYSIACIAICSLAAPLLEVTSWAFALDTLPLNGYLTYLAWKFYQKSDSNSSRKLFRFTLIHLPLLMTLMFINRKKKIPSDSHNPLSVVSLATDETMLNVT